MDDEFISFGSAEDEVEEEEEVPEEENDEAESGADYNIEDILKKAAITVKRQLDKLELYLSSAFGSCTPHVVVYMTYRFNAI